MTIELIFNDSVFFLNLCTHWICPDTSITPNFVRFVLHVSFGRFIVYIKDDIKFKNDSCTRNGRPYIP